MKVKLLNKTHSTHRPFCKKVITKHGHFAEHNIDYYNYCQEEDVFNYFALVDDNYGVMVQHYPYGKEWYTITGVIAPPHKRVEVLEAVMKHCLKQKDSKKFVVESIPEERNALREKIRTSRKFRMIKPRFTLYWPVFDMDEWDGHTLRGKKWKKLRNIRNRFKKNNRVRVVDSNTIPKTKLRQIVDEWVQRRRQNSRNLDREDANREYTDLYYNLITNNFKGMTHAKTMIVNGKPCSITAGWKIPNSKNYYSAVGVSNFEVEGLGEVVNLDDLARLKKNKYQVVDFGGSTKPQLSFKNKFKPTGYYKTYTYAIEKLY